MSTIVLTVSFDVQQISQKLDWSFSSNGEPVPTGTGANTGIFAFQKNDILNLVVVGNSHNGFLQELKITQCHLFCRPILYSRSAHLGEAGNYPPPSPFFNNSAVIDFVRPAQPVPAVGPVGKKTWAAPNQLLCNAPGRWEMSLILTAHITLAQAAGSYDPYRVFSFDPECEVGTGLGNDPGHMRR